MTNREMLSKMTNKELAEFMCNTIVPPLGEASGDTEPCLVCPYRKDCRPGHNGFQVWLEQEAEDS